MNKEFDINRLQEILDSANLPWHGDRIDGTVKYKILNTNDESVYNTD